MEWWMWALVVVVGLFLLLRILGYVTGRLQTGRAIEAFVVGVKAPQVAQDLAWWHLDGKRFMVAAGYIMGMHYSSEDKEARYMDFNDVLQEAVSICSVDAVTIMGQKLEKNPPAQVRARMRTQS